MPTKKVQKKAVVKKVVKKAPAKKVVAKKAVVEKAPTKKVVAKKAPAKSPAKKGSAKKTLVYAPDQASFWVNDGQILNSLVALRDALDEMEKEVFLYHTAKEQNDFAEWVANVLSDINCAKELAKANTPDKAKTVVAKHLKLYAV
ncbi:hypothetical protein H6784_01905 [Candidatus Nomurabacteria bacterium]|nr:hypothetical protein [Candidatus Kaiserbacteria bacterium]MCB9814149.1 hypothetical protein [Candidatus Nomurabacteria bacterium]